MLKYLVVQFVNITFTQIINLMDRIDFCKILISLRKESGIGKIKKCRMAGFIFN